MIEHQRRRQIRIAAALLAAYSLVATGGYMLLAGASFTDAFYMVAISISTVGYSEVLPIDSALLKWYTIAVIVVGMGLFFWVASETAQLLIHRQLKVLTGRSPMQNQIDRLREHFIVCGYGRMGRAVTECLVRRHGRVIVVEHSADKRAALEESNLPFMIADAADEDVLRRCHVETAQALVAATGSDATNVYITLSARAMRHDLAIVARCDNESAEPKLLRAGANRVIAPYRISAEQAAESLARPAVLSFMDVATRGTQRMRFEELRISPDSPFCAKTSGQIDFNRNYNVTLIALQTASGQIELSPDQDRPFAPTDVLVVFGDAQDLDRLAKQAGGAR